MPLKMSLQPLAMSGSKSKVVARLGLRGPNGEDVYRQLLVSPIRYIRNS